MDTTSSVTVEFGPGSLSANSLALLTDLPKGLCAERTDHLVHIRRSTTLGMFVCTADQEQREPFRSERRRVTSSA